jgi:prepilin-type N-terminal cleavage/methylation domain-containing protein/prepilin-type processing-associated H-X9-DG protein
MRYRKAFTLIELLVVIAIIAILAAILFPVFAQARAAARKTSCLSNIKQLALGMTMYAQDFDERFPEWHWDWSYNGGNGANGSPTNDGATIWWNAIYPYVKNAQVYVCPDNKYDVATKNDGAWGWFTANSNSTNFSNATRTNIAFADICIGYGSSEPLTYSYPKLAVLQRPSETLIVADNVTSLTGWAPHWNGYVPNGTGPYQNERISRTAYPNGWDQSFFWTDASAMGPFNSAWDNFGRHGNGNNVGFADGHAKFRTVSKCTIDLYGLPQ